MHLIKYISVLLCFTLISLPINSYALFSEMTIREERILGEKVDIILKTQAPILYDPVVQLYLQDITHKLLQYAPPQLYPFESNMIVDSSLNAFAVPGGYLFLNTGLFLKMENEDELAAIIAHEIAHVTQRHIAKSQASSKKVMLATFLAAIASAFTGSADATGAILVGSVAASQSAMLSYSRDHENEADNYGFEYMTKAGYNPEAYISSFKKLQAQFSLAGSIPTYLSSHPGLNERIVNIASRLRSQRDNINIQHTDNSRFLQIQSFVRAQIDTINNAKLHFAKLDKNLPMTQLVLGILYAREHNIDEAKESYKKLESLINAQNSNYAFYLREIGRFHYEYGDIHKAYAFLENALSINNNDYMAHYFLARTYSKLDNEKNAQEHYEVLLELYPYDVEIHTLIARSYGKSGNNFLGYLHLAYASLYKADFRNASKMLAKSEEYKKNSEDEALIEKFNINMSNYSSAISQ